MTEVSKAQIDIPSALITHQEVILGLFSQCFGGLSFVVTESTQRDTIEVTILNGTALPRQGELNTIRTQIQTRARYSDPLFLHIQTYRGEVFYPNT